jgi:hypothetical protein
VASALRPALRNARWTLYKVQLRRALSRRVTSEHPANGQRCVAKAIPPGRVTAVLQRPLALPIPLQGQTLPLGLWILQHTFEGGQARADYGRSSQRMLTEGWRGLVDD